MIFCKKHKDFKLETLKEITEVLFCKNCIDLNIKKMRL
jgi:hypothetical protein